MITVGYGDIIPQNTLEMMVSIITSLIGCGVFAYSLNTIGTIISQINKKENEILDNLNMINNYMKKKNITFEL
jgi:hypothetical protein